MKFTLTFKSSSAPDSRADIIPLLEDLLGTFVGRYRRHLYLYSVLIITTKACAAQYDDQATSGRTLSPVSSLRNHLIAPSNITMSNDQAATSSSDLDDEAYDANNEESSSPSPPSSSSSPLILYSPPTIWGLLRGAAINLLLPFVNGLMLGFGELFAHEAAFRLGWGGTKVCRFVGQLLAVIRLALTRRICDKS